MFFLEKKEKKEKRGQEREKERKEKFVELSLGQVIDSVSNIY